MLGRAAEMRSWLAEGSAAILAETVRSLGKDPSKLTPAAASGSRTRALSNVTTCRERIGT